MKLEHFSQRLLRFRELHDLEKEDAAKLLGHTVRYQNMLESGQKDVDPNSSLAKYFSALESGQIAMPSEFRRRKKVLSAVGRREAASMGEDAEPYRFTSADGGVDMIAIGGLNVQDMLAQIREDVDALEHSASQAEKRRTYRFLREVHLPMIAKALELE